MKTFSTLFWVMCSLAISGTAQAVAPTALYDNFNVLQLNPAKWVGGEWSAARANMESLRYITMSNLKLGNRLRLYARGSGASTSNSGTRFGSNSLSFRNPNSITAIKASVWANSATVTSCSGNPDTTRVRARLGGTFFNASSSPIPGNNTNDVLAQIRVQRTSNSTDAPNMVRVLYSVFLCGDSDCFNGSDLGSGEIGPPVNPGQKVTLSLEWDKVGNRFIFQRDALAPVIRTYTLSDASALGHDFKNLQAGYYVANCVSATPPTAVMDAYFDNVYTNPLPASAAMSAEMEETDPRHIIYGDSSADATGP